MQWFSEPKNTIEDAQALHTPELFRPAGMFQTPEGKFVVANLRMDSDWPPHNAVKQIEKLTGNKMIGMCDPLLGVWMPYQPTAA